MPLYHLDTSALAKRYVPERGSSWIKTLAATETISISALATAELASLLGRRSREGQLSSDQSRQTYQSFLQDRPQYQVLPIDDGLIHDAADLLLRGGGVPALRALDALQLIAARRALARAASSGASTGVFVSADRRLLEAAAALGLSTDNPEDHE